MNKYTLTKKLLTLLPDEHGLTIDQAIKSWWINRSQHGSFRLTESGRLIFVEVLDLEYYVFSLNTFTITPRLLLDLSQKINCPYYLEKSKNRWENIWLFGSKEAMTVTLWGDLERFLQRISR